MSYQPGIPTGSVPLNQDYLNIQNNFGQLNTQFNVDHVPLTSTSGNPPNGYHTAIHLVPQVEPATVSDIGEIWTTKADDGYSNDTILFQKTGGALKTQLSRNFQPTVTAGNGYTFIPGGLVYQFGSANSGAGSGANLTVTFPIKFTVSLLSLQLCVLENSNSRRIWHINTIVSTGLPLSVTGFTAYITDENGSNKVNKVYWTAVGN